jgi:enoyl-CoA hydratase
VGTPKLLVERRGTVTVLTLNRPEVHNCIDAETARLLSAAIEAFGRDEGARVLVVTGAGTAAFCSGADLTDVEAVTAGSAGVAPLGFSHLEPGKPRIAAVEGWCIAGGIELACWCDVAVAGEAALFGALNRRWGIPWVDGGTQRLARRVGVGNALYLLETGEWVDVRRALAMGLVQEVVPAGQALARSMRLAERVASYPQASLLADRDSVLRGWGLPLERGLSEEAERGRAAAEDPELAAGLRRFAQRKRSEEGGAAGALHP